MQTRPLGTTGFDIAPLVFGGNVFGWTVNEDESFRLLDAFVDTGLNAIDTADSYSTWVDGNSGGESETIIGNWLARDHSKRERVVIITKVGSDVGQGRTDLSEKWILEEVENSLRRLQVEAIDVYLSHWPDPNTPHEETLGAYQKLLDQGKIRSIGTSNFDAAQLADALKVADDNGLPRYRVLQPGYNLADRRELEGPLLDLCRAEELGVITYFSLAKGFLSGKYRNEADLGKSPRGGRVKEYLNPRGFGILDALDEVSRRTGSAPAEIALAWIAAKPGITAPIASATSPDQLASLARAAELTLSPEDIEALDKASA